MKSIIKTATIGGKDIDLAYTAWAMVDINRLLRQEDGTALELPKVILGDDPGTFELFCSIVEVLAYSAAMYKKLRGQDTDGVINVKEIMYTMVPTELISARQRAMEAVLSGLGRDFEIDLGLAELEKKSTSAAKTLICALNLRLKIEDLKAISAGLFYDMIEIKFPSEEED